MAAGTDRIDEIVGQWARERPDLDTGVMAVVARLLAVAGLMTRALERHAARHGVDRGQADVLFTLRRAGEPYRLSPSQLSENLLISSGTMTNRIDRLEQRGLVRRRPNPVDRRGLDVELTAKGLRLVEEAVAEHVANEQEMLAPLSARERDQLVRITRKLLAHLTAAEPAA